MPAWSFQPRFRFSLLNGLADVAGEPLPYPNHRPKRQTLRALRADGRDPVPGEAMRLWMAMRTPEREFLGTTPPIQRFTLLIPHARTVVLELRVQTAAGLTRLAHLDGFESSAELFEFFADVHRLPFAGYCFRW